MEQIYNISGTYDELKVILEKEFSLSSETARLAAMMLVLEQSQEQEKGQLEEETLWFLNDRKPEYQGHIFSTRYTISFSQTVLDILDDLAIPGILALAGKEELTVISSFFYVIKSFLKNIRHIKNDECCIYYQTLKYLKTHKSQWFSEEEIMPDLGEEKICIHLDKKWECKFRCGDVCENCNLHVEDVKEVLDTFCRDAVMVMNDKGTKYRYKT